MAREIEVRFLEIDKEGLKQRLKHLDATDLGEDIVEEIIFYDKDNNWQKSSKFIRLRKRKENVVLTYKHHKSEAADGAEEIEIEINDMGQAMAILEKIGLVAYRHQEKKRHSFKLNNATVDIDTWPRVPSYVEIEASSENQLKETAKLLGLDWSKSTFEDARTVLQKYYNIPFGSLRIFRFDRLE